VAIIVMLGAVTASASDARELAAVPALNGMAANGQAATTASKDVNFAGYQVNGGGQKASFNLTARFVLPTLSCASATAGIAPYIYLAHSQVGVFVGCVDGKAHYFPFIDLNGHTTNYGSVTFKPGDTITLHLVEGPNSASLSVTEMKHKITEKKTGAGQQGLGFPGIGDGSWVLNGHELPVPDFGTLRFEHCTRNGAALGAGGSPGTPVVFRYNRVNSHGVLQIQTSALSSNLGSFRTVFRHS
jgi:hypothetical protein